MYELIVATMRSLVPLTTSTGMLILFRTTGAVHQSADLAYLGGQPVNASGFTEIGGGEPTHSRHMEFDPVQLAPPRDRAPGAERACG
jgi:hypothetical protein